MENDYRSILVTIVSVLAVLNYLSGIIVDDVIGRSRYDLPYLIGLCYLLHWFEVLPAIIARYYLKNLPEIFFIV